jgi:hypothetical protein
LRRQTSLRSDSRQTLRVGIGIGGISIGIDGLLRQSRRSILHWRRRKVVRNWYGRRGFSREVTGGIVRRRKTA